MTGILWIAAGEAIPTALSAGAALVWHGRLHTPGAAALIARAALTPDDLADLAARPQAEWRAARRRVARALIAALAGVHPDAVIFARSPFGVPLVVSPDGWRMSIGGQDVRCAIAIAHGPVGVDVEPLDQPPLPDDLFTARELRTGGDRLLRWTVKEAHAKCFGRADAADPRAIETELLADSAVAVSADGRTRCFSRSDDGAVVTIAQNAPRD